MPCRCSAAAAAGESSSMPSEDEIAAAADKLMKWELLSAHRPRLNTQNKRE